MGGHGGLNILPQKRWHVYRDDNRLRVLRDEKELQETVDAQRRQRERVVMKDIVTLFRRSKAQTTASQPPETRGGEVSSTPSSCPSLRSSLSCRSSSTRRPAVAASPPLESRTVSASAFPSLTSESGEGGSSENSGKTAFLRSLQQDAEVDGPVMSSALSRVEPRATRCHINLFQEEEEQLRREEVARKKYLQQAGHSASRVSEFSALARALDDCWYARELPSNKRARQEREGREGEERISKKVREVAEAARERMQVVQKLRQVEMLQESKSLSEKQSSVPPVARDEATSLPTTEVQCVTISDSSSAESDKVHLVREVSARAELREKKRKEKKTQRRIRRLLKREWLLAAAEAARL